MAATGLAIADALPALAQVEGEQINTSPKHPVPSIQDTETPAKRTSACIGGARPGSACSFIGDSTQFLPGLGKGIESLKLASGS